jgi:chitin disaccharide deacetylase
MAAAQARFSVSLCADDYALSPGVSRGILEALCERRLTATSALVTAPSWPSSAEALRQYSAIADIGLHLNLTLGSPLGPMPKFASSGRFPPLGQAVMSALKRDLPEAEIRQEIIRQIIKFRDHFGAAPAFVDGHCHVQILPQVRAQLFAALEQVGLTGKVWLRDSSDSLLRILRRDAGQFKKSLSVAWLGKGFARQALARGFRTNDGFAGFSAFDPGRDYGADFAGYLRAPGPRHLVMCHPGYCDAELAAVDPATLSREQELRFLLSPAFIRLLERKGAKLALISDCMTQAPAGL